MYDDNDRGVVKFLLLGLLVAFFIASFSVVLTSIANGAEEASQDSVFAQMLSPSYKLYRNGMPNCSATVVYSDEMSEGGIKTHLLTAAHCVSDDMSIRIQHTDDKLDVYKETIFYAKKVRVLKDPDVAVLRVLDTEHQFPVALIADKESNLPIGRKVWVAGYPRALDLTLTQGELTGRAKSPANPKVILIRATAPIHGGSSGGAMFIKTERGYEIVGVTSGHFRDTSFMNYFATLESIYRALPIEVRKRSEAKPPLLP